MASRIAFGLVLVFAASAAAAAQPSSNTAEQDAYQRCLGTQTVALDDGHSPPETIGLAVASACLHEGRAMFATSPNGAKVLETHDTEDLRKLLARFATKVVLKYRSLQK
jgi:hypothetical protein